MRKNRTVMTVALGLMMTAGSTVAGGAQVIEGVPYVLDGDTLAIGQQRVRLDGIDAPESSQACYRQANNTQSAWACGQQATEALRQFIGNQPVACQVLTTDRYGRFIARCSVVSHGRLVDLGGAMVYNGWALAYTQYSKAYVGEQEQAKSAGRGIWSSHWQSPADYRRQSR